MSECVLSVCVCVCVCNVCIVENIVTWVIFWLYCEFVCSWCIFHFCVSVYVCLYMMMCVDVCTLIPFCWSIRGMRASV